MCPNDTNSANLFFYNASLQNSLLMLFVPMIHNPPVQPALCLRHALLPLYWSISILLLVITEQLVITLSGKSII